MKARTEIFNNSQGPFHHDLKLGNFRNLYKTFGVTRQQQSFRLGGRKLLPHFLQLARIKQMQKELLEAIQQNYVIVQVDESCFSPDGHHHKDWAPKGQPLLTNAKYSLQIRETIACIAAISEQRGLVHSMCKVRSFKAEDVVQFLKGLREQVGKGVKLAVFWDNARVHVAKIVKAAVETDDIDIKLIQNVAYRPDFNGIEQFWMACKVLFRKQLQSIRVNGLPLNMLALVEHVVSQVPLTQVQKCASDGYKKIWAAKVIEPLDWEQGQPNYPYPLYMEVEARQRARELKEQQFQGPEEEAEEECQEY